MNVFVRVCVCECVGVIMLSLHLFHSRLHKAKDVEQQGRTTERPSNVYIHTHTHAHTNTHIDLDRAYLSYRHHQKALDRDAMSRVKCSSNVELVVHEHVCVHVCVYLCWQYCP